MQAEAMKLWETKSLPPTTIWFSCFLPLQNSFIFPMVLMPNNTFAQDFLAIKSTQA